MSSLKQQTVIEAPVEVIWELVGNPERYPEWWPRMVEVRGERFEEGDEYVQVVRSPMGRQETSFLLERVDDLREIRMRCQTSGTYAHWQMTAARGSTFANIEFGMDPTSAQYWVFDRVMGRMYFRRWLEESIEALRRAAQDSGERDPERAAT
jgi:ribosome-associated toxin RatA of RatAB toxin-antitoxin module